jgi:hypothetical protein
MKGPRLLAFFGAPGINVDDPEGKIANFCLVPPASLTF